VTSDILHLANQDSVLISAPRVLVVDDAPTVRLYHGSILRAAGLDIVEAGNGFEALELALNTCFDLMIIDVNMPHMDGHSLVTRLRSPDTAISCPIVMISTECGDLDGDTAYRAGANLFLTKPVAPELLKRVAQILTAPLPPGWLEPSGVQTCSVHPIASGDAS